jgi:hypothetical protein
VLHAMATPMSVDDLEKKEEEEFRTGPLSVLTNSVKTNSQVRTLSPIRTAWQTEGRELLAMHPAIVPGAVC